MAKCSNFLAMGFLEWLGDAIKAGPVGYIQTGSRAGDARWQPRARWLIWLLTLIGLGFLGGLIYLVASGKDLITSILFAVIYLVVAWFFTPVPDHTNIGWAGGLINNPFRFSDNANRFLAFLAVVLLPGKLIVYAVQTVINTIRSR